MRIALPTLALIAFAAGCENGAFSMRDTTVDEDPWAIRCITLYGPGRMRHVADLEKALRGVNGLKPEWVQSLHTDDDSAIFYGRYARALEPGAGRETFRPDPQRDLQLIRSLTLPGTYGPVWPFLHATLETLPSPDRDLAEWDLNLVKGGYWTWHVAVFYNEGEMRQRKRAAVEWCRELRKQGEEAYFHHGPEQSSVCIGLFPREAIKEVVELDELTGMYTTRNQIIDPRMLELERKHPYSVQNGHVMRQVIRDSTTGAVKEEVRDRSFPVRTPWAERQEQGIFDG